MADGMRELANSTSGPAFGCVSVRAFSTVDGAGMAEETRLLPKQPQLFALPSLPFRLG